MDSYSLVLQDLGRRARQLRLLRNFQQKEVARRAGVTPGTVHRFEATGRASMESVLRIAMALSADAPIAKLFEPPKYLSIDEALARPKVLERKRVRHPS